MSERNHFPFEVESTMTTTSSINQEELDLLSAKDILIVVGTYEGVLAGWTLSSTSNHNNARHLSLSFASPTHQGSIRSLAMAATTNTSTSNSGGILLSTGYDEVARIHALDKKKLAIGEVRTEEFGVAMCSAFCGGGADSSNHTTTNSTHCLLGFNSGKLAVYKRRDWSIQHVLAGHTGGVAALAVHPTSRMALSAGQVDGKLKLWNLTTGRMAFATTISSLKQQPGASKAPRKEPVTRILWSPDATCYGYCHGNHITVIDVDSGKELLDVELPSTVNDICFLHQGQYVAAACNDGSLPVLAIHGPKEERPAIMAIEPVDGPVAGEERFKCIKQIVGAYVATANSAGIVSLMNLQGAINMISTPDDGADGNDSDRKSDEEDQAENDDEEELAVDIIDGVQLGTGARITCLDALCFDVAEKQNSEEEEEGSESDNEVDIAKNQKDNEFEKEADNRKRKHAQVILDEKALEKARSLVSKAKKIQKRKDNKKQKKKKITN